MVSFQFCNFSGNKVRPAFFKLLINLILLKASAHIVPTTGTTVNNKNNFIIYYSVVQVVYHCSGCLKNRGADASLITMKRLAPWIMDKG